MPSVIWTGHGRGIPPAFLSSYPLGACGDALLQKEAMCRYVPKGTRELNLKSRTIIGSNINGFQYAHLPILVLDSRQIDQELYFQVVLL